MINTPGTTRILFGGPVVARNPAPARKRNDKGKHDDGGQTFGVIFANDVAREVMSSDKPRVFPVGSIIVREKLTRADAAQPELLAVMVKRARGFNPKGGDWEFLVVDGAMTKVKERQKKGSCLDCHASQREMDFVFLPPKQ